MSRAPSALDRAFATLGLDSIKNRILALAVLVTLGSSLAAAIMSYRQSRDALTQNLTFELRSRGSQAAREVGLWVRGRSLDVRVLARSFEVSESLDRIRAGGPQASQGRAELTDYLASVHGGSPDYDELLVADASGETVASSRGPARTVGVPDEWVARVAGGEIVVGDPVWDAAVGEPVVTLLAPIESGDARFLGLLAARLTFAALDTPLGDAEPDQGGRVDVVTAEGMLVASSDDSAPSGAATVASAETLAALRASGGGAVGYVDRSGTPVVGTLTPVPGLAWSVIAQIPSAEAYAQLAALRSSTLLLVTILLVGVGVLAYLLGSVIVRPLERLSAGANALAAGDLTIDLPEGGHGEVGELTQVFNDMVHRLRTSREALAERTRELERLAVTDLLTGLHNRRYLIEAFEREIARADRHERPFCVIMLDVDRFKQFNDTYGHPAGDEVLVAMSRVLAEATRDLDICGRYGGEEFIALLPECGLDNGVKAGERIRERLSRQALEHGPVTVSVGVAEFPMHGDSASAVIGAADEAMYEAKRQGRDRVCGARAPVAPSEGRKKASRRTAAARKKRS